MSWRLATALRVLRDEANAAAPRRSKASDGTIGDAAHTSRTSDHNPDEEGVVKALDLTHDPIQGADMHAWSEFLRGQAHPALSYIIWNRRITSRAYDNLVSWRRYNGPNPHTAHMHVSVRRPFHDSTEPWSIDDMADPSEIAAAVWAHQVKNIVDNRNDAAGNLQTWTHLDSKKADDRVIDLRARMVRIENKIDNIEMGGVDIEELAERLANILARRLES